MGRENKRRLENTPEYYHHANIPSQRERDRLSFLLPIIIIVPFIIYKMIEIDSAPNAIAPRLGVRLLLMLMM